MSSLSAIVVAAGRSQRFSEKLEKQTSKSWVIWDGKPLIQHTLEALSILPLSQLSIVLRDEEKDSMSKLLSKLKFSFPIVFSAGGARRQDSVRNGLSALTPVDFVFVHDAARPFLEKNFLNRLWNEAQQSDALVPGLPVVETLKEKNSDGFVEKTHDRNRFVRIQTPQFFRFSVLEAAHRFYKESSHEFTDDAAMVETMGIRVKVADGHFQNVKVTVPDDLKIVGVSIGA